MGSLLHWLIFLVLGVQVQTPPVWSSARIRQESNPNISRAMRSVQSGVPRAAADPNRPVFHYRPPAFWMNDPNGTIFHEGFFHLFYQHNPFEDSWGSIHWGHAVSRDLVYWEDLPIALWPSRDKGEEHCFSGSARINSRRQPMLFYTSVSEDRPNQQWAALGGSELITWTKHPDNPILDLSTHGGPPFDGSWRDPFLFEKAGRVFLILGATEGSQSVIPIYEAADGRLNKWEYRGTLFQKPREEAAFLECPNFFELDGKWILLYSPYRPVEYVVGSMDLDTLRFIPETAGVLDFGVDGSSNFYATNVAFDPSGRCILLGWVRGFREGVGWNGCLALPRVLRIGSDNKPRQQPIPQLESLRQEAKEFPPFTLENEQRGLDGTDWTTLELKVELDLGTAEAVGLRLGGLTAGTGATVEWRDNSLEVAGSRLELRPEIRGTSLSLHIFLDKSVLEVFIDGGREAVTRVVYPEGNGGGVEVYSEGGAASVHSLMVWKMSGIWSR